MKRQAMAAAMGVMAVFGAPGKAQAYDIDCAIMLCMAGTKSPTSPATCIPPKIFTHSFT